MTDNNARHAAERLTWCITTNAYADEDRCHDAERGATRVDHDHYDLVVDEQGKTLFRIWPVGTTFLHEDGARMRVRTYRRNFDDVMAAYERGDDAKTIPERPVWDVCSTGGGASTNNTWLPAFDQRPVDYVLDSGQRPSAGSVFLLSNGETWRLSGYSVDWLAEPFTGDDTRPRWVVSMPGGSSRNGDDLPHGARLVWAP